MVYQPMDLETGVPRIEERVIAIKTDPHLHLEYYQRDLSDGMRSPWAVPVSVLTESVDKLIEIAKGLDETVEPVVGFGYHSPPLEDVDHDELWLAMLKAVRQQQPVFIEHEGCLEIKLHQNIERTMVLRDHPLEIEVCECNIHSGFRVHSEM